MNGDGRQTFYLIRSYGQLSRILSTKIYIEPFSSFSLSAFLTGPTWFIFFLLYRSSTPYALLPTYIIINHPPVKPVSSTWQVPIPTYLPIYSTLISTTTRILEHLYTRVLPRKRRTQPYSQPHNLRVPNFRCLGANHYLPGHLLTRVLLSLERNWGGDLSAGGAVQR